MAKLREGVTTAAFRQGHPSSCLKSDVEAWASSLATQPGGDTPASRPKSATAPSRAALAWLWCPCLLSFKTFKYRTPLSQGGGIYLNVLCVLNGQNTVCML